MYFVYVDNCVDKSGEEIPHGKVFSPDLSDPCKSCTCDYGQATGCAYMYCDVPNCRYEMIPGTCCGFICLDSTIEPPGKWNFNQEKEVDCWSNFSDTNAPFLQSLCQIKIKSIN